MLHDALERDSRPAICPAPPPSSSYFCPRLCSNKEHARRRTETELNEISTPTERRRGERRGSGADPNTRYSSMPYAAHVRTGLLKASLLTRQSVEVRAGGPRSQRVSHLGVSGARAPCRPEHSAHSASVFGSY